MSVIPIQQLTGSPLAKFLQAYRRTAQASLESARTLPAGLGAGPESVPPAAGLHRFSAVHFSFLPPSCLQHGLWPQPSLLVPASPRRRDSCLTLCPASAAPLFSPAPRACPGLGRPSLGSGGRPAALTSLSPCLPLQPGPTPSGTNVGSSGRSPSKAVAARAAGSTVRQR